MFFCFFFCFFFFVLFCFSEGAPLVTVCGDTTKGFIGVREPVFFIEYHKYGDEASNGFKIQYKFVVDTFTPAPPHETTPSPVGGDNGMHIIPASILLKSISDRYRLDSILIGPITVRYRFNPINEGKVSKHSGMSLNALITERSSGASQCLRVLNFVLPQYFVI